MITLTHEEAQQVLDVMEGSIDAQEWEINDHITKYGEWFRPQRIEGMKKQLADTNSTIETLRARLSAPEPEPVAWMDSQGFVYNRVTHPENYTALYAAPPQREWQVLTDKEYETMAEHYVTNCYFDTLKYAKAVEAKLKEKNA